MAKGRALDLILLLCCSLLLVSGVLILASVSSSLSLQRTGTTFYYLNHQLLFGFLPGLVLGAVAFFLPLSFFKKWGFAFLLFSLALLALVFVLGIGREVDTASRWIFVGGFSFQPSELLKLAFILYMASWLASRASSAKKEAFSRTFVPFAVVMAIVSAFLILQPNVSTLGVIAATGLAMYFLAGTPLWHTFLLSGFSLAAFAALTVLASYRWERLQVFLDPSLDPLGKGYQLNQALIGIGSGGLFGTGLGLSFQKFGVLPEPISDSIFAVFAEETGFLGSMFLISLFALFAWRVFVIARRTHDRFAGLCATGIGVWISLQAFVNIASMLALVPLTGIPLPFISYGGSALVVELIALGILLNISKGGSAP
ncbi:MAG TPA: putative lipid II flippase FtsW [Candidatus Wildermuthbacteria bacterium]|uniref:Probable peptidoglycan glycosyltransferase FtsW n=1 Tax=Candidatus Yanofskybacteria bacterium GW2011_GWC1_48_11 TaxID=1619027 RepID=A0A837IPY0_9BACT|nr:MAG: cell division membrane protein, cell division protein FtsW [Candidatus Yanofskybacteria bacterium GW2011_GWC1_48_11]KKW04690.1 MAG: Stage V sporulation protein E [Parcubacteria group bacterium GW2011_GWB1_49_12]KKW09010.1 MAG: Stage V sporulation protein E [Parcubacteria group bacterium GW2011_GWA1_49_26]KKW14220.1 MAG: Stage V sporulation protein E [Parcubacteria group bacterium GW2011_GWA2_50_10]OHA61063.1 MAG: cell division protein FtsW [Candidatus Wildermuthbacteria bacterium GWA1_4